MSKTWTDSELIETVRNSTSLTAVLRALNLRPAGRNFISIKEHIHRLRIDTEHFVPDISGLRRGPKYTSPEMIFCENSSVKGSKLRKYVLKFKLMSYTCVECGNEGTHNNKPLTLQIDHINGVNADSRIENLRFLCPNCHSQTSTYARRKPTERKISNRSMTDTNCTICGKPLKRLSHKLRHAQKLGIKTTCKECVHKPRINPDLILEAFREIGTYLGVAKKLGVSDALVRRKVLGSRPKAGPGSLKP